MADEFDPDNPTFYGESYPIWWATNVTGAAVTDGGASMTYLHADTDTQTINAGESIIIGVAPREHYLTDGDAAIISWVIETDDDSSGTIALRCGKDPDWDLNPALAVENLGSVTVSGRQTIALEQATYNAADIFHDPWPAPILLVEATAGSVSIRQVRLRVWPRGTPDGQWVPAPGYAQQAAAERMALARSREGGSEGIQLDGSPLTGSAAEAWGTLTRSLASASTNGAEWSAQGQDAYTFMYLHYNDTENPTGWFSFGSIYPLRATWVPSTITPGRFPHPDVVAGDATYWGRSLDGGPILTEFTSWGGSVGVEPPALYGVTAARSFTPDPDSPGSFLGDYRAPTSWQPGNSLPPPIPDIIITPVPPEFFAASPSDGYYPASTDTGTPRPLTFWANELVPDHLVWDPSLPWQDDDEPTPRFFWKDDLGNYRAIGPGKPADDLVLFKIKTAMGIYSEPRPGDEPGSGAHPLRVKIDNGYGSDAWDTPVWMEPQD